MAETVSPVMLPAAWGLRIGPLQIATRQLSACLSEPTFSSTHRNQAGSDIAHKDLITDFDETWTNLFAHFFVDLC